MNSRLILLASTSPYRRHLLSRLHIDFEYVNPSVDESPIIGEPPDARALRLAEEKARAPGHEYDNALILGGDQTIASGDDIFDKPHTKENAIAQLKRMRKKQLRFYTAVSLFNTHKRTLSSRLTTHTAWLRNLSDNDIIRYVSKEPALNCAGGAQIEGLGISLMDDIQGGDPTALIGMSLIETTHLLRYEGIDIP